MASLTTFFWLRFLHGLNLGLKHIKSRDCARDSDQIDCLFGLLNFSFNGRSLSRPAPSSFNFQDPGANPDDYLDNAAQTLELANRASAFGDESHLTDLAERWLDLADEWREGGPLSRDRFFRKATESA
jgi:hypothetical protein